MRHPTWKTADMANCFLSPVSEGRSLVTTPQVPLGIPFCFVADTTTRTACKRQIDQYSAFNMVDLQQGPCVSSTPQSNSVGKRGQTGGVWVRAVELFRVDNASPMRASSDWTKSSMTRRKAKVACRCCAEHTRAFQSRTEAQQVWLPPCWAFSFRNCELNESPL